MKTQRKQGWMVQAAAAVLVAIAALAGEPVSAHDFGGTSSPNPPPTNPPDDPCKYKCCDGPGNPPFTGPNVGKPIDVLSGAERFTVTDLTISSIYPIEVTRRYDSSSSFDTALGFGWSFAFDRRLFEYPDGSVVLRTGCGLRERFVSSGGTYVTPRDGTQGTLVENGDGTFDFRYYDGTRDTYDADGRLVAEQNRAGHRHEFLYDPRGKLPLTGTSPFSVDPSQPMIVAYLPRMTRMQERSADGQLTGYALDFTYDENTGRLTTITGNDGREVHYSHDVTGGTLTKGNLTQVDGLGDLFYFYKYEDPNDAHNATWIQFGQNGTPTLNTYDTKDRVTQQNQGATQLTFTYVTPRIQTNVTRKIYDDQGVLLYTNLSKYYFDEAGYLTSEVNPAGYEKKSFYTANKDLEHVEWRPTFNGTAQKSEAYTFDGSGHKLTQSVHLDAADGGETITKTWTYDHDWIASEQVVSDAAPTKIFRTEYTFVRDANNVPVAIESVKLRNDDGSFATTTYGYCTTSDVSAPNSTCPYLRLLKSIDGPRTDVSDVTTYSYYPSTDTSGCANPPSGTCHLKGSLWKITNAFGQIVEHQRYDLSGRLSRVADLNNIPTDLEYDSRGRLLARKVRGADDGGEADDAITRYTYDDVGNAMRTTRPDGSYLDYAFDGRGRLTGMTDNASNSIHYALDSEGNRLREETTDPASVLTRTLGRSFDNLSRVQQSRNASSQATTFTYDVRGNATVALDPLGHSVNQSYDDLDRLTKTVRDAGSGGIMATTKFTYDAANNLRKVVDPKNLPTDYTFDAIGNLTSVASPDTGATTYTYDAAGNRLTQTDARGVQVVYTYDALNRLRTVEYPGAPSLNATYSYDLSDVKTGCLDALSLGHLSAIADASGTTVYCYDRRGNVVQKSQQIGGTTLAVGYTYDLADHLTSISYPGSGTATYTRNSLGQITSVDFQPFAGPVKRILQDVDYLPFGGATLYSFSGGQTLNKSYDKNYWMTDVGGSALNLHFARDAMGNITTLGDAPGVPTILEKYGYDGLYRLTSVKDAANTNIQSFTYDATGDRLSSTAGAGSPETYVYQASSHRLQSVAGQARSYDNSGNTIADASGSRLYTYDERNRLTAASVGGAGATYQYDGSGERVSKTAGSSTTLFLYDEAGSLLGEYSAAGVPTRVFVYADGVPVATASGTAVHYIHTDQLGSPRAVTTTTGSAVWRWPFSANPFGAAAADQDPDGDGSKFALPLRFPGQYYDSETGAHYNGFRDYEAKTGRYLQSDPIGLRGGINTYRYSYANSLLYFDELGAQASCRPVASFPGFVHEELAGSKFIYSRAYFNWVRVYPKFISIPRFLGGPGPIFQGRFWVDCAATIVTKYEDTYHRWRTNTIVEFCTEHTCDGFDFWFRTREETEQLADRTEDRFTWRDARAYDPDIGSALEGELFCLQWIKTLQ